MTESRWSKRTDRTLEEVLESCRTNIEWTDDAGALSDMADVIVFLEELQVLRREAVKA